MLAGQREHDEDLLNLKLPCYITTDLLTKAVTAMYDGGGLFMTHDLLMPLLKLADAIQVSHAETVASCKATHNNATGMA